MNSAERTTASLLELYQEHSQQVTELQHLVQQQYPQQHPAHAAATAYLNDRITLFRFLKKANYDMPEAYNLVEANVAWRITAESDQITPRDLEENPLWTQGLVQLRGQDRYGHPLITIRLGKYVPAPQQPPTNYSEEDMSTDEVDRFLEYKRYIIFVLECTRKMLWESSRRQPPEEHALQATLILDLQGASVSDLDHQLITYTIELLKHRYPSCIAQGNCLCHKKNSSPPSSLNGKTGQKGSDAGVDGKKRKKKRDRWTQTQTNMTHRDAWYDGFGARECQVARGVFLFSCR